MTFHMGRTHAAVRDRILVSAENETELQNITTKQNYKSNIRLSYGTWFPCTLSDIHSSAGMVLALIYLTFTVLQAWY